MFINHRFCECYKIIHQIWQIEILLCQRHFSTFNTCHIQHFINQPQQMTAWFCNFTETFNDSVLALNICSCNCCQADNGIHRCPDIVGHIGKEFCFRTVCIFCRPVSLFQCLTGFNLCFLLLCHIHGCQQYLFQLSILPFQRNIRSDLISLFIQAAVLKLINIIFTFQILPDIFRCDQDVHSFQWFQCLILFKNLHLKIMIESQRFI